jgi:hypothetical protein
MISQNMFVQRSSTPQQHSLHVSVSRPAQNVMKQVAQREPQIVTTLDLQISPSSSLTPYVGLNNTSSASPLTDMQQREGHKKKLNLFA